ncbi:MAG: phage terminase large subunit [Aeromonadaceae bacterium]
MLEFEELNLAQRVALKQMSQRDFLTFTRLWFNLMQGDKLRVNWHHHMFADLVDDIIWRRIPNRNWVINVPPGSTKTEFFSIHLPAYVNSLVNVGKLNRFRNLNLSFSNDLVIRNSVRTRDIIASHEYQSLFQCAFGVNQAQEWTVVDHRGKRLGETVSRSVGGQITGSRAGYIGEQFSGLINLDDPDKPADMLSEVKRKRQHDYTTGTIRSRRGDKSKDNATPLICIAQRTHVDDTSGFLLANGMGIKFEHMRIPALITEEYINTLPDKHKDLCWTDIKDSESVVVAGQRYWSFWPENEDIGQLMDLWEIDEYTFLSQYMQEPIALSGHIFNADWFKWYGSEENPHPPYWEFRFITADTATKTGTRNDFSVMCEWGVYLGNLYLINMVRGKWEAPELEANFRVFIGESWQKNQKQELGNLRAVLVEDKASGTGLLQTVGRESPLPLTPVQRSTDKLTRAMDTAPQLKAGKVYLPEGAPWIVEFVAEHSLFSADDSHKHDDIVDNTMDAVSYALIKNTSLFDMIYR